MSTSPTSTLVRSTIAAAVALPIALGGALALSSLQEDPQAPVLLGAYTASVGTTGDLSPLYDPENPRDEQEAGVVLFAFDVSKSSDSQVAELLDGELVSSDRTLDPHALDAEDAAWTAGPDQVTLDEIDGYHKVADAPFAQELLDSGRTDENTVVLAYSPGFDVSAENWSNNEVRDYEVGYVYRTADGSDVSFDAPLSYGEHTVYSVSD